MCVHLLVCFLSLVFVVRGYAYICVTDQGRGSYLFDVTVFCVSFSSPIIIYKSVLPLQSRTLPMQLRLFSTSKWMTSDNQTGVGGDYASVISSFA